MDLVDYLSRSKITRDKEVAVHMEALQKMPALFESMRKRKHPFYKNEGSTYRLISHWSKLGLVDDAREGEGKWRKFSVLDLIWQRIIISLRGFGVANSKILLLKEIVFSLRDSSGPYPLAEFYFGQAFLRKPSIMIIYEDGFADFGLLKEVVEAQTLGVLGNHIQIDLSQILFELFKIEPLYEELFIPVSIIGKNKLDSLELQFDENGGLKGVVAKDSRLDPSSNIREELKKAPHMSLEIKNRDGKVAHIQRTVRIKPQTKPNSHGKNPR